ncbi:BREX system ATP-binding domain-containing protein [Actinoplanes derwentensis]|uniref:AAA+ ATPase domain-containing protein n=1 Tax=Actinoplanes derwentensis TaxID=113562 RepID=A0A1H1T1E4_9ACTN|nr:BREX system ATP-binding domain-containing protein [Actinoplanes derwentensis]GID89908.1 hypothetical protein Ade03nite_88320 [Actinoplanes derwentensis]SDS53981.1 hypothetical protein SAMN04489716_1009 [Actinoplanes derwentensis]
MSADGELRSTNPFSPSAVAATNWTGRAPVTVSTDATEEALRRVYGYLEPQAGERNDAAAESGPVADPAALRRRGITVGLVGEYGSGKTHLAMHLLRSARLRSEESRFGAILHESYMEAPDGTFDVLYRRFMEGQDPNELRTTLRHYYADAVADVLARSPLTVDTARRLRNREVDADDVVEKLGLIDSILSDRLRDNLLAVTQREEFAVALTMFLRRKEFAEDIWTWLSGGKATQALIDRGFPGPIRGNDMALEAMGVFAMLYGRRHHRFVMVIDELHNILKGNREPDPQLLIGFRKLFEVFEAAGACLVMVGLPDLWEILGGSTRERLVDSIEMAPLEAGDVRNLIEQTQAEVFRTAPVLAPFADSAPALIASVTQGNPRQIIKICQRAYDRLLRTPELPQIDTDVVLEVAAKRPDLPDRKGVRREIRHLLSARGLIAARDTVPAARAGSTPVDFWVTSEGRDPGCAVLVSLSITTEQDSAALEARARQLRAAVPGAEAVLVVIGYLDERLTRRLSGEFGNEPLLFSRHDFAEEFTTTVTAALARIAGLDPRNVEARLLERVTWLAQQQSYTQSYNESLAARVEDVRAAVDRQFTTLRTELGAWRESAVTAGGALPEPVDEAFREAYEVLGRFNRTATAMQSALSVAAGPEDAQRYREQLLDQLSVPELYAANGVVALLTDLVNAFRWGISEWFARPDPDVRLLTRICGTYDALYFEVQVPRLDHFPALATGPDTDDVSQSTWRIWRHDLQDQLEELGARVQEAARRSSAGAGP